MFCSTKNKLFRYHKANYVVLVFRMQKTILLISSFLFAVSASYSQNKPLPDDTFNFHINSLRKTSFKKAPAPEQNINNRVRAWDGQLMYWPYYPSTAQQMENRFNKDNLSVPQYIISEVVTSLINSRKNNKRPSGQIPRF